MYKPSLRKSVLSDKLCLQSQIRKNIFHNGKQQQKKAFIKPYNYQQDLLNIETPSMIVPKQLLQNIKIQNNGNYTNIFTPLTYDFKEYPKVIKQAIKSNPNAAQAGRIKQINYLIYDKYLYLWKSSKSNVQSQKIKIHKFQQRIDIIEFSQFKNQNLFRDEKVIVGAICLGNRLSIYKIDQKQLNLQDLMLKYRLKSCKKIQKIKFTSTNQLIFAGDSGQISMISFNKQKQVIVNIKSPFVKKYLSKSAFDYSCTNLIKDIEIGTEFIYCLKQKFSKSNYLMFCLKSMVNKIIRLSEEPKYINKQTFIDIYRFSNSQRKQIVFVDQLKQKQIENKIKQGYMNFWGQGVPNGFEIVSLYAKLETSEQILNQQDQKEFESSEMTEEKLQKRSSISQRLINPILTLITKCGYIVSLTHEIRLNQKQQKIANTQKQKFSFLSEPTKIVEAIGDASLFESKTYILGSSQKKYRRNSLIGSISSNKQDYMYLLSNALLYSNNLELSMLKFDDLKKGIFQTTIQEEWYLSQQDFINRFERSSRRGDRMGDNDLFKTNNIFVNKPQLKTSGQYYRLFNNQKRWTVFDNQGRFHIYKLELKHILLTYLYYQYEFSNRNQNSQQQQFIGISLLESDLRINSILEKIIKIYGYTNFIKELLEILIYNSSNQRQYFYIQKQLFFQIVKKQFQYDMPIKFQDWNYNLSHRNSAQKIITTQKMLQLVWIILFQYEHKVPLYSEAINITYPISNYHKLSKQYQDINTKLQYSAYGYALKLIFSNLLDSLIYFRAKQFKVKQQNIRKCQQNLIFLKNYLESKKSKSQTFEYKNYLNIKLKNILKKKEQDFKSSSQKLINSTFSTTFSSQFNNSIQNYSEKKQNQKQIKKQQSNFQLHQSNQTIQKLIVQSIKKVNILIEVMSILIQKDQREGLPNFLQIVTDLKNQIKLGQEFFKQQIFISQDFVQFVHPQLVRQAQIILPELKLKKKIDYLKFKSSRNILYNKSFSQIDLKSIDMERLSLIVSSNDIMELRSLFLGSTSEFNFKKIYFYNEFLSICLKRKIQKVRQLSNLKEIKFGILFEQQQKKKLKEGNQSRVNDLTIQKIILALQQLQFNQIQMGRFYGEIREVFQKAVKTLKLIKGEIFYQCQKYLQRIIQVLMESFGSQDILVQELEMILKSSNFIQKIEYLKTLRDKKELKKNFKEGQILKLVKQDRFQAKERTTFQYLLSNYKPSLSQQKTLDTQRNNSLN